MRPYDPRKAAPLTSMSVSFDGKSYGGALWRIVTRPIWYNSTGGVLGYVKHPVVHYREKWSDNSVNSLYPYCDPLFQVF